MSSWLEPINFFQIFHLFIHLYSTSVDFSDFYFPSPWCLPLAVSISPLLLSYEFHVGAVFQVLYLHLSPVILGLPLSIWSNPASVSLTVSREIGQDDFEGWCRLPFYTRHQSSLWNIHVQHLENKYIDRQTMGQTCLAGNHPILPLEFGLSKQWMKDRIM